MSKFKPVRIVGLLGAARSGKNTASEVLMEHFGYVSYMFASDLKDMMAELLRRRGCPELQIDTYLEGNLKEVPTHYLGGKTPRHAMQTLGTEWGRNCMGGDFWCKGEMEKIAFSHVMLTDVRFQNEVDAIRKAGGILVRITRPGREQLSRLTRVRRWLSTRHRVFAFLDDRHSSERLYETVTPDIDLINDYPSRDEFKAMALKVFDGWHAAGKL